MSSDAIIPYTVGGEYKHITEYIELNSIQLKDVADSIQGRNELETSRVLFGLVCREIKYPLDWLGRPTTAHKFCLFPKYGLWGYLYVHGLNYVWRPPSQVWASRYGFCACTANLCTTLLRLKGIQAWTRLGAVLDTKTGNLLGFHAWTEIDLREKRYLLETTVHPDPPPFIPVENAYGGKYDITYDPFAIYNELFFEEDEEKLDRYRSVVRRYV